jgi:hypothetical protein
VNLIKAKLQEPGDEHGWTLHFTIDNDRDFDETTRAAILSNVRHFGAHWRVDPFVQGENHHWIMIEFLFPVESYILEASLMICKQLKIELEL